MWHVIVEGKRVDTILAWDKNDAWVYATRKHGMGATVERVADGKGAEDEKLAQQALRDMGLYDMEGQS